jgi:phage shock protein PspC (stress-responsive transcriptional regulator)
MMRCMNTTKQDSPQGIRRLTRRDDDKMIAGVAGGIADYVGVDAVIVRIVFVLLLFAGGVGVLLYAAGWFLIPPASGQESASEAAFGRLKGMPAWLGIVLLIIGIGLLIDPFTGGDPAFVWAIVLVAIGIVLLRDDPRDERLPPPPPAPDATRAATPATSDEPTQRQSATASTEDVTTPIVPSEPTDTERTTSLPVVRLPRRAPRERSPLGWFTVAAVLMAVGGGAVLENWDVLSLDVGQFFALALLIVGAGLLVGALWGRSRLMIVLGLLLVPMVLASSLIDMPLRGSIGDLYLTPRTAANIEHYELFMGQMTVDLTRYDWVEDELRIDGDVAMGQLEVIVPRGVRVEVDGRMEAGELSLFRYHDDGVDLRSNISAGPETAERTVILDLDGGIGSIQVDWAFGLPPVPVDPDDPNNTDGRQGE